MGVTKVVAKDPYSANYNHKATIAVANTLVSECSELQIRPQFQVDGQFQADCRGRHALNVFILTASDSMCVVVT
ncbi:hypothetical protein [Caballeronia mineralivorans]|jgi:hypothetical protein|uniref:hypothetical protein n=1 Tax=Caballeronia mineralivorans TaxID=2010198 RepID=UPI0023F36506|nr:hypothetical protein [Caballeronia mineralivorans]MDB5783956.1 hypothetical protein [Caballeronia mineralivorans]